MNFNGKSTGCLSTKENKFPVEAPTVTALQHNPAGISLNMSLLTVGIGLRKRNI